MTRRSTGKLDGKTPTAVEGSKVDGKLYMVPESLKAVALFYDSAKIATPPATTDELLAGVKDGTIKAGFFGGKDGVYHNFGWWAAFGGALMDDSGKCIAATTGVPDAYKYLVELQTAGAKFYPSYDDMATAFKAGDLDLIVDGPWATGGYKTTVPGVAERADAGRSVRSRPAARRRRRLVHQPRHQRTSTSPSTFALRMTDQSAEQVFVDTAGHIPANTDNTISDPITQGLRRRGGHRLPASADQAARQLLGQLRQCPAADPRDRCRPGHGHRRRVRGDGQGERPLVRP